MRNFFPLRPSTTQVGYVAFTLPLRPSLCAALILQRNQRAWFYQIVSLCLGHGMVGRVLPNSCWGDSCKDQQPHLSRLSKEMDLRTSEEFLRENTLR